MDDANTRGEDPGARVRQLLLSGDNIIKNRDAADRYDRARERYLRAREIAVAAALGADVIGFVDRRLESLPEPRQ